MQQTFYIQYRQIVGVYMFCCFVTFLFFFFLQSQFILKLTKRDIWHVEGRFAAAAATTGGANRFLQRDTHKDLKMQNWTEIISNDKPAICTILLLLCWVYRMRASVLVH